MTRNFVLFGFFATLFACIARRWGPEVFAEDAATGRMVFVNGIEGR